MIDLTERQAHVLRCMREVIKETDEDPPLTEIADCVGRSSKSAAHHQLGRLRWLGYVAPVSHRPRAYRRSCRMFHRPDPASES